MDMNERNWKTTRQVSLTVIRKSLYTILLYHIISILYNRQIISNGEILFLHESSVAQDSERKD